VPIFTQEPFGTYWFVTVGLVSSNALFAMDSVVDTDTVDRLVNDPKNAVVNVGFDELMKDADLVRPCLSCYLLHLPALLNLHVCLHSELAHSPALLNLHTCLH
jgi:hypothetical protein